MKIIFMSQGKAEKIKPDIKMACISITEPPYFADLRPDWGRLLRLQFDDIDKNKHPDVVLLGGTKVTYFDEAMANKILDFVDKLPNHVDMLVIHCHAGISRSAAVSMALHNYLGIDIRYPEEYQLHNRFVATTIVDEINRRRDEREQK